MTRLKQFIHWYGHALSKAFPYHEWVCDKCTRDRR